MIKIFHYCIADDVASQSDGVKNDGPIIQLSTYEVATSVYNKESDRGEIQAVNEIEDDTLPDMTIEEIEMLPNRKVDTPENKQRKNSKLYNLYSNTYSTRERVC